jgi:hypothetical protein
MTPATNCSTVAAIRNKGIAIPVFVYAGMVVGIIVGMDINAADCVYSISMAEVT